MLVAIHTDGTVLQELWFHFGGDEVDTRCWGPPPGTHPNITGTYPWNERVWKWLQARNLSGIGSRDIHGFGPPVFLQQALGYWYQRVDQIAFAHGLTPVHWAEAFDTLGQQLDKRTIIQVW